MSDEENINKPRYVSSKAAKQLLQVHTDTLRRWADSGKIASVRHGGKGHRYYDINSILGREVSNDLYGSVDASCKRKQSVIVESLPVIKKMIYKDKLLQCENDILLQSLSMMLAQVLTGSVKVSSPLLNRLSKKMSHPLSSITGIDYVDLLTNSLSSSSSNSEQVSWFSIKKHTNPTLTKNSQTIYSRLSTYSHVKKWDVDDTKPIKGVSTSKKKPPDPSVFKRIRKYQVLPTKSQRIQANKHMSRCRWTVNQGIAHFNSTSRFNAIDACDEFVTQFPRIEKGVEQIIPFWMFDTRPKWIFDTPKVYRYNILRKLASNIKSAFSNLKAKNIKHFKFRFRSKRKNDVDHQECDEINWSIKTSENGNVLISMPGGLTNLKVKIPKSDRKIGFSIEKAGGLTLRRENNGWYVDLIYTIQPPEVRDKKRICAVDPGQRSFLSGFDLQGNSFQLGIDVQAGLRKLKFKRNLAQSRYDTLKVKTKNRRSYKEYQMFARAKRAFYLTTNKIKNYIKQLHYHSCKYLTDNYDKIIIPVYGTQKMVKTGCKKWNDMILSLNHFSFRSLLISKCEVLRKTVIVSSEEYTSVTCGKCNSYKMDLEGKKVFNCSQCDYQADRDENAAFNILRFVINTALPVLSIE